MHLVSIIRVQILFHVDFSERFFPFAASREEHRNFSPGLKHHAAKMTREPSELPGTSRLNGNSSPPQQAMHTINE